MSQATIRTFEGQVTTYLDLTILRFPRLKEKIERGETIIVPKATVNHLLDLIKLDLLDDETFKKYHDEMMEIGMIEVEETDMTILCRGTPLRVPSQLLIE